MRVKQKISILILLMGWMSITGLYAKERSSNKEHDEYNGSKDNLHIYLLIGQSNMAGRASFTKSEGRAIKGAYLLNDKNKWESARNPLNQYSTIRGKLGIQKMNPGYQFALTMLEKNDGVAIGLVVNAKGGAKIVEWGKDTQFYNDALKRTKEAQKTGTLKGILWHQGESDSSRSEIYLRQLSALITNLREDLNEPNLPFVAGQVFYDPKTKPNTKKINEEIAKLPETVPFTGYVKSEGLIALDHTHFDTKGMKTLGKRYAEEMVKVLKITKAKTKIKTKVTSGL